MVEYRLYLLNAGGRIRAAPVVVEAEADDGALALARGLGHLHVVEVWERARMVGRVGPPGGKPD